MRKKRKDEVKGVRQQAEGGKKREEGGKKEGRILARNFQQPVRPAAPAKKKFGVAGGEKKEEER